MNKEQIRIAEEMLIKMTVRDQATANLMPAKEPTTQEQADLDERAINWNSVQSSFEKQNRTQYCDDGCIILQSFDKLTLTHSINCTVANDYLAKHGGRLPDCDDGCVTLHADGKSVTTHSGKHQYSINEGVVPPEPPKTLKKEAVKPPVDYDNLRDQQARLIGQQMFNVVEDRSVIKRAHRILVKAYLKQMDLMKSLP